MSRHRLRLLSIVVLGALAVPALHHLLAFRADAVVRRSLGTPHAGENRDRYAPIRGQVLGAEGAVCGATVRWQGTSAAVTTDGRGDFTLPHAPGRARIAVSASGHYIATLDASPSQPTRVTLEPLPTADNQAYAWVDPAPCATSPDNCGNCHGRIYTEWRGSAHARAATNPRLRHLIEGIDVDGRPEPEWHMRRDHPDGVTVCNACHAPTLEPTDAEWDSLVRAVGVTAAGVHCDFCHKVQAVDTARVGLTHGRYAMRLLRPDGGRQIVFGPLDDTERADTAAAAFYRSSTYCAACHEGTVFGVKAYSTYSEWQRSPPGRAGLQCQDCHMAASASVTNMAPGRGGIERDSATLSDHSLGGLAAPRYEHLLDLQAAARTSDEGVEVTVTLDASRVGHHVPTGFVDRHMVLLLDAKDAAGTRVVSLRGQRIPEWAGADVAGHTGALFAKSLSDAAGRLPAPLWSAAATQADTRLEPTAPRILIFLFDRVAARIRVRLLHRHFWEKTRSRKKWDDDTRTLLDEEHALDDFPLKLLPTAAVDSTGHAKPIGVETVPTSSTGHLQP